MEVLIIMDIYIYVAETRSLEREACGIFIALYAKDRYIL